VSVWNSSGSIWGWAPPPWIFWLRRYYPAIGIRIVKYLTYGFSLLTPIHFNFKRFEASPTHISNHDSGLRVEQNNNNEHRFVLQLSDYHYNNNNDYEYRNLVRSRNHDCFNVQQKFRLKILFDNYSRNWKSDFTLFSVFWNKEHIC
jgi:hypothetical protein